MPFTDSRSIEPCLETITKTSKESAQMTLLMISTQLLLDLQK